MDPEVEPSTPSETPATVRSGSPTEIIESPEVDRDDDSLPALEEVSDSSDHEVEAVRMLNEAPPDPSSDGDDQDLSLIHI